MNHKKIIGDRAVVIGGSIAGLLSARVLVDYFTEVIVVERDCLPKTPQPRRGVPQSVQPHILLTLGYRILLELFGSDFKTELLEKGALTVDWGREFYSYNEAGWFATTTLPSGIISLTCSRPLLEFEIAQRVKKHRRIKFWEKHRVNGLIYEKNLPSSAVKPLSFMKGI